MDENAMLDIDAEHRSCAMGCGTFVALAGILLVTSIFGCVRTQLRNGAANRRALAQMHAARDASQDSIDAYLAAPATAVRNEKLIEFYQHRDSINKKIKQFNDSIGR